jgi:15-cis-phytoene desaturase
MSKEVIIIGAGLAGMSAAVNLSEKGYQVTVLEANRFIGGRCSSWDEKGMHIESGFHRFLGFYTALPDLIHQVGKDVDDIVFWEDEVEIRTLDGLAATLGASPLHKPLKTMWNAFGHNDFLPPSDKLALGKMFAKGLKDYKDKPLQLDQITVTDYARQNGVSDTTINNLLTPLTEGVYFVPPDQYSMHNLVGLFAPYLTSMHKQRVGAFAGGMTEVMMQPMADYVIKHGGKIITNTKIDSLLIDKGSVIGATSGTQQYRGDVILATSLHPAQQLVKKSFGDNAHFQDMLALPSMPAVTFQIELSRPSMELDRTTFGPGTIMASFAEQSRTTFRGSKGRISIILSEPEKQLKRSADDIIDEVKADAQRLNVDVSDNVLAYRKVDLPHDFYSLRTGHEAMRPPQETPVQGLILAGDYTKQQYLSTMEGAVVSGKLAADIVLKA